MKINATVKTYNVYFLAPTEDGTYEVIAKVTDGEYSTVTKKASEYAKENNLGKDVFRTTPRVEKEVREIEM